MQPNTAPVEQKSTRRRKVQAVLAGGTVLGIGALVTLAAWNDSEFTEGIFGAGSFNLEGTVESDEGPYADNPEGGPVTLDFSAENMVPDEAVYAPFWVRLDSATTVGGAILPGDIEIVESGGENAAHLAYEIFADPANCQADGISSEPIGSGSTLEVGSSENEQVELATGDEEAGEAVQLCFVVTANPDDYLQDVDVTEDTQATWQIEATSDDS